MGSKSVLAFVAVVFLVCAASAQGQTAASATSATPQAGLATTGDAGATSNVPRLIKFNGVLRDLSGKPIPGPVDVTFSLYAGEAGGNALWFETQTVQADALGSYTVLLGAMTPTGVPMELFTEGQAHWLGVQIANFPEQPRVLLVSVPYAMKAGDAETLGGRPAAEYQLTPDAASASDSTSWAVTKNGTTTNSKKSGKNAESPVTQTVTTTQNYIPVYSDNLGNTTNSIMFQSGTKIGVNTNAPAFNFDVNGNVFAIGPKAAAPGTGGTMRFRDDTATVRWLFGIPGSAGSQDFFMYNYTNGHSPIYIQNGAASYSLYLSNSGNVGVGTSTPAVKLDVSGNMRVISGSSVASTPQLALGGMGFVGLSVAPIGAPPAQILALQTDSMGALGYTPNGGTTYPFYINASGQASISGALSFPATSGSSAGVISIGGTPFVHGCCNAGAQNTFIGGAGNFTTAGSSNTAVGVYALGFITGGYDNTATGRTALYNNTTGASNTANGAFALNLNTTGFGNTAVGYAALSAEKTGNNNTGVGNSSGGNVLSGQFNTSLGSSAGPSGDFDNSTAVGALAYPGASNTMVLGSIIGVNGGTANVNVGIGTTTPISPLQVATGDIVIGPTTTLPYSNTNGLYVTNDGGDAKNTFRLDAYKDDLAIAGYSAGGAAKGTTITFRTAAAGTGESNRVRIDASGQVGIGTLAPGYALDVVGDIHTSGCIIYNGGSAGSCATPSDMRLKQNIRPFGPVLDRLIELRPVHYEWNPANPPKYRFAAGQNAGLIAQDVEKVFPAMVTTGEDGYKRVYYNELPYLLLEGERELKARNDSLQSEVRDEKEQIAMLRKTESEKDTKILALAEEVRQLKKQSEVIAELEARLNRDEARQRAARSKPASAVNRQKTHSNEKIVRVKF